MKHLWEEDHSYYCDKDGSGERYSNLDDFLDEWGECDMDYNLLFRWDWKEFSPNDYEEDEMEENEERSTKDTLYVFWMHQRKGRYSYCEVKVTKDEEDQVKEFLKPRWEYMKAMWEPLA